MYEKSYGTARLVLGIVAITGWIIIVIGLIALVSSFAGRGALNWQVMIPGVVMLVSGLVLLATSQVSFAVIDQADISRANLLVLQRLAEAQGVSLQSKGKTAAGKTVTSSTSSPARKEPTLRSDDDDRDHRGYMGYEIIKRGDRYYVNESEFITLGKAKAAIKNGQV
ncbi:hypothetical protein [Roseovarius sp. E0-M6]|uniref:hypothetical protein n=1 Tax=Roseovarius sp. E0-M6 TaxID=3127118 RepID=UPI0030105B86